MTILLWTLPVAALGIIYREEVPRFKVQVDKIVENYLQSNVKFSCLAISKAPPAVTWYHHGKMITSADDPRFRIDSKDMSLEVRNLMVSDQGVWSCKVSNSGGYITRNFTLEIIDFCSFFYMHDIPNQIPTECLCLWYQLSILPQAAILWKPPASDTCTVYKERLDRQIARHKARCTNPPCDIFGRPKSHAVSKIDGYLQTHPVKLFDWIVEHEGIDVHRMLPKLISFDEMWSLRWLLKGWKRLTSRQKVDKARYIVTLHQRRIESIDDVDDLSYDDDEEGEDIDAIMGPAPETTSSMLSNFSVLPSQVEKAVLTPKPKTPPYFDHAEPRSIVVPAGRTIRLKCNAHGEPEPKIVWLKNNKTLVKAETRLSGKYIFRKQTLEMEDATELDSAKYACEAYNEFGHIMKYFDVHVMNRMRSAPIIVPNIFVNQTVNVNGTVTFRCRVLSDLVPNIVWLRVLTSYDAYGRIKENFTSMSNVSRVRIYAEGDTSTMTIENVTIDDQGVYSCLSGNWLGMTMENATLTVNDFTPMEIPVGIGEPEYSAWNIVLLSVVVILLTLLAGLCLAYFTCITYVKRKQQLEDRVALLSRRKKIVVTHKAPIADNVSDPQSNYQIQVIEHPAANAKGRRPRLSSDLTLLDDYEVCTDPIWEVDRSRLKLLEVIGSGAFGEVWRAQLQPENENDGSEPLPVAVKKVRACATERDLVTLVGEMEMFKSIGEHRNVLRLVGCCTGVGPLYVLLELCEHGNLRDFLKAHRPREDAPPPKPSSSDYLEPRRVDAQNRVLIENLTLRHLVEFAKQIAEGMNYMASKKIVHRDLAARNVLVAKDFVMKISDFGLSRDVHYRDYYRKHGGERMPYKWMAIESLDENQISTVESDVWSFGVLLWEIMTMGGTPYPTIEPRELYNHLKNGYRMEAPQNCPSEVYALMSACWQEKRDKRPSFDQILNYLDWMLSSHVEFQEDNETCNSDGSDDIGRRRQSRSEDEDGPHRRRAIRPLSAPVALPPDGNDGGMHETEMPRERAPMLSNAAKTSAFAATADYAIPRQVYRQQTDPSSETYYAEPRAIPNATTAASIDSAIGSPAWHLTDPHYAVPILGNERNEKHEPSYINVHGMTRFPFPPALVTKHDLVAAMSQGRRFDYDSLHNILQGGNINSGYAVSPQMIHVKDNDTRRHSGDSRSSGHDSCAVTNRDSSTCSLNPLKATSSATQSNNNWLLY